MEQRRLSVFAERFSKLRGNKTQDDFAKFLGISRPTVGFYENGTRLPDALVLKQISEKCNVSADWLLGLSDVDSSNSDIQTVCKFTGLSERATKSILELQRMENYLGNNCSVNMASLLSMILENPCLEPLMEDFQFCLDFIYRLKSKKNLKTPSDQKTINDTISKLRNQTKADFVVLPDYEIPHYYRTQVENFGEQLIHSIIANYEKMISEGKEASSNGFSKTEDD